MPDFPEARARKIIDQLLTNAGWIVQSRDEVNLAAGRGVAIREFPMKPGFGRPTTFCTWTDRLSESWKRKKRAALSPGLKGRPQNIAKDFLTRCPRLAVHLPFCYQSTGIETRFTNLLEPDAASRNVFSFHRPETLAEWLGDELQIAPARPSRLASGTRRRCQSKVCVQRKSGQSRIWNCLSDKESLAP